MNEEEPTQRTKSDRMEGDEKTKREENRHILRQLLNPISMSAEQNKSIKDYPKENWQMKGCTGRWDGFHVLRGTYKSIPEQDHMLEFLAYVPKEAGGGPSPLLISWHGGGFFTGAADYVPWDARYVADLSREVKAIVVSFNYRLLPYVDGSGLLSDVEDALSFIHSKTGLEKYMQKNVTTANIDWNRVMVTGESAGGFLSVYTWLKSQIPLKALYLRYPMLKQYEREPRGYGGVPISKDRYEAMVQAAMDGIETMKKVDGSMPVESSLHPPTNMPAANIFSSTNRWRDVFQHQDILQMLEHQTTPPLSRPKIIIVHGTRDAACRIENSVGFKKDIEKKGWINGQVDLVPVSNMDHGFDYCQEPLMEGCEWLREVLPRIRDAWVPE